jgi:hypothetical protein
MSEESKTKPLMTKKALMDRIELGFTELQRLARSLDAEAAAKPHGEGAWTVKDMLLHIADWEEIFVRFHLGGEPLDEVIGMEGAEYRVTSFDVINDHLFKRNQAFSLDQVKARLEETHQRFLEVLKTFPEEDLHQPHPRLSTGEAANLNWIDYIAANSYEHYQEHMAGI